MLSNLEEKKREVKESDYDSEKGTGEEKKKEEFDWEAVTEEEKLSLLKFEHQHRAADFTRIDIKFHRNTGVLTSEEFLQHGSQSVEHFVGCQSQLRLHFGEVSLELANEAEYYGLTCPGDAKSDWKEAWQVFRQNTEEATS